MCRIFLSDYDDVTESLTSDLLVTKCPNVIILYPSRHVYIFAQSIIKGVICEVMVTLTSDLVHQILTRSSLSLGEHLYQI